MHSADHLVKMEKMLSTSKRFYRAWVAVAMEDSTSSLLLPDVVSCPVLGIRKKPFPVFVLLFLLNYDNILHLEVCISV